MKTLDADYGQIYLLPPSVEDWIGADHPARFIREIVAQMDLQSLGFKKQEPTEGRPPYSEELLLRVWLYGYWKKIRSSRKLEEACREDMGFIWLCGQHRPDHNTLWRFFNRNKKALRKVFKHTVKTAMRMDLVGLVLQAVDGTKIQAICSGWQRCRREDLERTEWVLEAQIKEIEQEIELSNKASRTGSGQLPQSLANAQALRERVKAALKEAEDKNRRHINPTELDARRMECEGKNRFGYNGQAVVDSKNQVIVAADVTAEENDFQQLSEMATQAKENTGADALTVADSGYSSARELLKASEEGLPVLVNLHPSQSPDNQHPFHASRFRYDPDKDLVICPQNRQIPFQRIRKKRGMEVRVYRSCQVCSDCPVRDKCTTDRHGRTIDIQPGRDELRKMAQKLQNQNNQRLLAKRKAIVEPVFAQIKQHGAFRRWTHWGLENAKSQWSLLCSTWNLKVIYRHWCQMTTLTTAQAGLIAQAMPCQHVLCAA